MKYRLLPDPEGTRHLFVERFAETFEAFSLWHKEWISGLKKSFDREHYDSMFMWDKLGCEAQELSFAAALAYLEQKPGEVLFLGESLKCSSRDFSKLSNWGEFAAAAEAKALAECISYEWFTDYELFEQGQYLTDALLPSDLYVFDKALSWCLVFTHETDESEKAESRLCLLVEKTGE